MFENIPLEMRYYDQWIVWRLEERGGKITKIPYSPRSGRMADICDPEDMSSYHQALNTLNNGSYSGIGFCLTEDDPYVIVDLDDATDQSKKQRSQEEISAIWADQKAIYDRFASYSERSPSGKGLHIIGKGKIPEGRRTGAIEIYSSGRYMTMTGNVYQNVPIRDCNEVANDLYNYLNKKPEAIHAAHYDGTSPETMTDDDVVSRGTNAANGDKFRKLIMGFWQEFYSSQSEADFALMDMIAFYTHNKSQIVRIFQNSELGKRDKAKRPKYLEYMLSRVFDKSLPPVDTDAISKSLSAVKDAVSRETEKPIVQKTKTESVYIFPPGLLGRIAQYIYECSPRQVPEIALVAAIGMMGGICGRAYNVSRTGLNQYVLLLAPTGTGKEGISAGVSRLINAVSTELDSARRFIGPNKIASEQALYKHMSKGNNSFVSIVGEFGIEMSMMTTINAAPHKVGIMKALLDLYNKSGNGNSASSSIYSDSDKNTKELFAPSFSMIGESVPESFYENLHEGMITSGFLPRFTVIEYNGKRPKLNKAFYSSDPDEKLVNDIRIVCSNALNMNNQNKAINVGYTPDAENILDQYEDFCTERCNTAGGDLTRQFWTRAHLKVLRLAALVSVGINPYCPIIDVEAAQWAIKLVTHDTTSMLKRFENGDVGSNNEESRQIKEVQNFVREYINGNSSDFEKYGLDNSAMHKAFVIPWSVFQRRLHKVAVFKNDKMKGTFALKRTLQTMVERGDFIKVSPKDASDKFFSRLELFQISNPELIKNVK